MRNPFSPHRRGARLIASEVRIIGVGSPFGDDSIAWSAIDFLDRQAFSVKFPSHSIELSKSDRPGIGLLELMRDCRLVVLIDAMQAGSRPGTIRSLSAEEVRDGAVAVSSHDFGIKSALAIGEAMGDIGATVEVIGIEVGAQNTDPLIRRDWDRFMEGDEPATEGARSRPEPDTAALVRLLTDVLRHHGITSGNK